MVDVTAQGDFGPHTQVRLTEWIENVPVKDIDGRVIGRAKVSDTGMIHAVIDDSIITKEVFNLLRTGISDALSIETFDTPAVPKLAMTYTEEVKARLAEQNPFNKEMHQ